MSDCPYRDKRFSKCRFEARYDLGAAVIPVSIVSIRGDAASLEQFRPKKYVHDVCIHCGRTIERAATEPQP